MSHLKSLNTKNNNYDVWRWKSRSLVRQAHKCGGVENYFWISLICYSCIYSYFSGFCSCRIICLFFVYLLWTCIAIHGRLKDNPLWVDDCLLYKPSKLVSEWLSFNANSTLFQLCHGENKLICNVMMMRSALH